MGSEDADMSDLVEGQYPQLEDETEVCWQAFCDNPVLRNWITEFRGAVGEEVDAEGAEEREAEEEEDRDSATSEPLRQAEMSDDGDAIPKKDMAKKLLETGKLSDYQRYKEPVCIQNHRVIVLVPNGKRYCGFLVCVNCKYGICFVRLGSSLQSTLKSLLYTPDQKSTAAADNIRQYFDTPCLCEQQETRVSQAKDITHMHSLYTGRTTIRVSQTLSQHVKRLLYRFPPYMNYGRPLSAWEVANANDTNKNLQASTSKKCPNRRRRSRKKRRRNSLEALIADF
eukprot:gb/GECG01016640.1/.p1 GENE.gb/GECG01016640.1/~~gb/GECG01016640.1/.p1  ORF type:complete len:283 (+),score=30.81 gb/GECG01016640.1/:1-849(+)